MSRNSGLKSNVSVDSIENQEILSELSHPNLEQKSFLNLISVFDQRVLADSPNVQIPKESRKRLQVIIKSLFNSLVSSEQLSSLLTLENTSILSVYVHSLLADPVQSSAKKQGLIKTIGSIMERLNESLITDIIEPAVFQKFMVLLIRILNMLSEKSDEKSKESICCVLSNLLLGAAKTFHRFYFDLFSVEDCIGRGKSSIFLNMGNEGNLVFLALSCLSRNFPHSECRNEKIIEGMFVYLSNLVERSESDESSFLVVTKKLNLLTDILAKFQQKKNKIRDLSSIEKPMVYIWKWVLEKFVILNTEEPNESFLDDPRPIGLMFSTLLRFLSRSTGSDGRYSCDHIEKFPVNLFVKTWGAISQEIMGSVSYTNKLHIQIFMLQFCVEFYKPYVRKPQEEKKNALNDSGLISFLLRWEVFVIPFGNSFLNLANHGRSHWKTLWGYLSLNKININQMIDEFILKVIHNYNRYDYTMRCLEWLGELEIDNSVFLRDSIKEGLVLRFITAFKEKIQSIGIENSEYLLKLLNAILNLSLVKELENRNLIKPFDSPELIHNFTQVIEQILLLPSVENHKYFKEMLKKQNDQKILISLLTILYNVFERTWYAQKSFLSIGVIYVIRMKLNPEFLKDSNLVVEVWRVLAGCSRSLLLSPDISKRNIEDFDFISIAEYLSHKNLRPFAEEISEAIIEDLELILYKTREIQENMKIQIPQVVPLVFQVLTHGSGRARFKEAELRLERLLLRESEVLLLASFNALDVILKYFSASTDLGFSEFFERVISRIISLHIPPQALSQLLNIIKFTSSPAKKKILLQTLNQAISKSDTQGKFLSPSKFFYFEPTSSLEFKNDSFDGSMRGKVSIILWFKAKSVYSNSVFFSTYCGKSSWIKLEIHEKKLLVRINENAYFGNEEFVDGVWNFVCISIRLKKTGLRNKNMLTVCVNERIEEINITNEKFESKVFSWLVLGSGQNSDKSDPGFEGKMSSVFIIFKSFSDLEITEIRKLFIENNLNFSTSSLKSEEHKVFKDLKKSLIFEWRPSHRDPFWVTKPSSIVDNCKRFNGVSLFEAIKLNGGLKIFLSLVDLEHQVSNEIISVTDIILNVFLYTQSTVYLTPEFVHLLGHVVTSVNLFSELISNLIKIITSLKDPLVRARLLKLMLLNESIDQIPAEEKTKHLQVLIPFIRGDCDRENLFIIYRHIKKQPAAEIQKVLESYIPKKLSEASKETICFMIVQMAKDKFSSSLEALLTVLLSRGEGLTIENDLEAGMVFLLGQSDLGLMSPVIKLLLKDVEYFNDKKLSENSLEIDRYSKIIKFADSCLESRNIDHTVIQSIFEAVSNPNIPVKLTVSLLDIITNRLSYTSQNDEDFLFFLTLIEQHVARIQRFIYQSAFFPDWLCNAVRNAKKKQDLLSLCNIIFVPQDESLKLSHLSQFVRQVSLDHDEESSILLFRLIKRLFGDYQKIRVIAKNEAFHEFLKIIDELEIVSATEEEYIQLVQGVLQFGINNNLIFVAGGSIDISFNKLRASIRESKENSSLKLIISIIFKGLYNTANKGFLESLKYLLESFNYFSVKSDKKLNPEDFLLIEIFANLSEVYLRNPEILWIDCFIQKTAILTKILLLVDSYQEAEIRKLIEDIESQKVSMRSNTIEGDEKMSASIVSEPLYKRRSSTDGSSIKEIIKAIVKPEVLYPDHLRDPDWQNYVQNLLVQVFQIRKVQVKSFDMTSLYKGPKIISSADFSNKTADFKKKYDDNWNAYFDECSSLVRLHIAKKYKAHLRNSKRLKAVLSSSKSKKLKVRPYLDQKNRQSMLKPCSAKDYSDLKFQVSRSPAKTYKRNYSTVFFESFLEKSGDLCPSLVDEEDNELSETENLVIEDEAEITSLSEKNLQRIECERITIKGTYYGMLETHGTHLLFISEGKTKPEGTYPYSALEFTQLSKECKRTWDSSEISEIICRRFLHQHTALEIYLKSGKSYLFNVFDKDKREELFNSLKKWKGVRVIPTITAKLVKSYTKNWLENKLDNFEYILALNRLASRSFHDLSQYPIFPWVIKDFTSAKLDLSNPEVFRNLSFSVGSQEERRREEMKKNYTQFEEEGIAPFHHGSHYSNGAIVVHYLVRIEPFSYQARLLQNNSFDVPDRLFINMENAWKSCLSNGGDVKELVPELYFFADALFNINSYNFGVRQNGMPVSDFDPPPWAKNNWDFIRKHRKCLESPYVTENLHNWFDLIFGYKQSGPEAVKNLNVFHAYTYEEDFAIACSSGIDEHSRKGIIEQAYHFGQTPVRLFLKQHPGKKYEKPGKTSIFDKYFREEEEKTKFDVRDCTSKEEYGRIFALASTSSYLFAVKWDYSKGKYFIIRIKWEGFNEFGQKSECYELEGFCIINLEGWTEYQGWKSTLPKVDLKMILDIGQSQFAVWEDKYLVSAFHVDDTFKINSSRGELKKSVRFHCGLVTCVFTTPQTLFTGGIDSTVISWRGSDVNLSLHQIYLGHSSSIRQIQASESYSVLISLSASGTILLHDIRNAECLRKITEPDSRPARIFSISEMGIIAVAFMEKEYIGVFGFNGTYWDDSRPGAEDVWCMMFNKSGEYLITGSNRSIAFFDIFNKGNGMENLLYHSVDNTVLAVALSKDEEFIAYAINRDNRTALCCLKVENKADKQNVIDTIRQFA